MNHIYTMKKSENENGVDTKLSDLLCGKCIEVKNAICEGEMAIAFTAIRSFCGWKYRQLTNDEGWSATMKMEFIVKQGWFKKITYETFTHERPDRFVVSINRAI